MRVAFALPMTTAGATDRGTANGIEIKGRAATVIVRGTAVEKGVDERGKGNRGCTYHL